jgi:hypothetical protein
MTIRLINAIAPVELRRNGGMDERIVAGLKPQPHRFKSCSCHDMKFVSKIDIIDKYAHVRKIEVRVSEEIRKATKLAGREKTHETIEQATFFCKAGEEVSVVTDDAGAWCIVVVIKNKKGETNFTYWNDLIQKDV